MGMSVQAAIWLRVSEQSQTTLNQLGPLRDYAEWKGLEVEEVYDVSGVRACRGPDLDTVSAPFL